MLEIVIPLVALGLIAGVFVRGSRTSPTNWDVLVGAVLLFAVAVVGWWLVTTSSVGAEPLIGAVLAGSTAFWAFTRFRRDAATGDAVRASGFLVAAILFVVIAAIILLAWH
jgi:hypothetical protein